ncbi:MAG: 1-acyl-sn-glycerol-3-phosphate acyltransferase [Ardenticatenia bacterium]|nr:1-acyl-sn-glycerol-3-phosphate acyltransferase [Ardenticatenia bacterium]
MEKQALIVDPILTARRRLFRWSVRSLMQAIMRTVSDCRIEGIDEIPAEGPLLVVMNHLGLLDAPLLLARFPRPLDAVMLDQMVEMPVLGKLLRWYGVIPVRRDHFDRQVLQRALAVLRGGRALAIAPEAGVSDSGALRQSRAGVAYLAVESRAPLLPVAITGTEKIHGMWDAAAGKLSLRGLDHLAFWRREHPRLELKVTFGRPFTLEAVEKSWREKRRALRAATDEIMGQVAALLPSQYRGVYLDRETSGPSSPP